MTIAHIISLASASTLALAAVPASATAVNVVFTGTFATGESLAGSLTYQAVSNPGDVTFVEFANQISNFTVTSDKFLTTNGTNTLYGANSGDNRIRYFSGDAGVSFPYPGLNGLQFIQNYATDTLIQGYISPWFFIGISAPAYTFSPSALPTSFNFSPNSTSQLSFYYQYVVNEYGQSGDGRAILDSIIATPAVAAVPEPATWAMMIAGFGMVGGTMRRRTRAGVSRVAYA